ncbi:MAG: AsmA-like C-terminal region-containing protein [Pirellulales bacterium]
MPDKAKQVWEELQPTGSIDSVTAVIKRPKIDAEIDTEITLLEGRDASPNGGKKSLRLLPRKLPYLLDDVSGKVVYRNGLVTIEDATAQNGATRLSIKGECSSISEQQWLADITWLPNTRVMVDSQFVRALPVSIQESMRKLDFYGPISIKGKSQTVFGKEEKDIQSAWDCMLDIEDGRLASGAHLAAMRGTIWLRGNLNSQHLNATGQIAMDAMRVLKTPVTNMTGPFVILDSKLFFGSAVQEALPNPNPADRPADITASALAGTLKLSGSGRLDTGKFYVDSQLQNARLSYLLKDIGIQSQQPDATCNATLKFSGVPWNPQTYDGDGEIKLTDAKLYELPFMMRLFSVTSVNASDASAFQTAECKFQLDGEHIPLQISADGEVLRLRGEGWTNLRRDVDLQLYTYVGRKVPIGAIVSPLLPESRFSTFMMVEVTGTLDNPDMQRKAFPQLEATLQQMFPEVAERRPIRDTIQRWKN